MSSSCGDYRCGRISSEFMDCSFPLTADPYNWCSYNCQYCFAVNQKVNNPAYKKSTFGIKCADSNKVIKEMQGKTNSPYYDNFYKYRFPIHFGGLADPFEVNLETKYKAMLPILQYLADIEYPTLFSSKGVFMTEHKDFLKCFEKGKKSKCFAFQFSIIGNDDDLVKKVEIDCPSTTERLASMKVLSDMGYWTILRLRPFIVGISDINLETLLERAKKSGAKAISMEFMCSDLRSYMKLKSFYDNISKAIGFDIMEYYKKLSPTSRGTYLRLNTLVKESFMRRIMTKSKELDLKVAISDPDFKWLNFSGSCCGMPRGKEDYPSEIVNWSRGQLTYHLVELRKRYWETKGKDKHLTFEMLVQTVANKWANESRYFHDYIKYWNTDYRMARSGFIDAFLETWNNIRSPSNPYCYFDGVMKPSYIDKETQNIVYEYNPCESELRMKKEGII